MKTYNISLLVMALSLSPFVAGAQNSNTKRTVPKEVQRITNAKFLNDDDLLTITAVGYPAWTISKGVQLRSNNLDQLTVAGNIVSEGYPTWIISKGVHKKSVRTKTQPEKPVMKDVIAGIYEAATENN